MRKVFVVLLGTAMLVGGCFGGDGGDSDVIDVAPMEEVAQEVAQEIPQQDTGPVLCAAGESAGYKFVMVKDSLDNPTLDAECGAGNPGADIDSVCVYRDDAVVGCAKDVTFIPWADATCQNDKNDPTMVLGVPDGVACEGKFENYFSLNGGTIIVNFDGGVELLCGDEVRVTEMPNCKNPEDTLEYMTVSYGAGTDCMEEASTDCQWSIEADWAYGDDFVDVSWEW
jgi:hypothetical protein